MHWLAIAIGGALGSALRWAVSALLPAQTFPYGTAAINLSGSYMLGWLYGLTSAEGKRSALYQGAASGFFGGYTTMSALGLEAWTLLSADHVTALIAYIAVSALGGPLLAAGGIRTGARGRRMRKEAAE